MRLPDDVWNQLLDEKLAKDRQSVAKVAVYFITYILDVTGGRARLSGDKTFETTLAKLKALAEECPPAPEAEVTP